MSKAVSIQSLSSIEVRISCSICGIGEDGEVKDLDSIKAYFEKRGWYFDGDRILCDKCKKKELE